MGFSQEYHSFTHSETRRKKRKRASWIFVLVVIAILLLSAGITAIFGDIGVDEQVLTPPGETGIATDILAPLPMQGGAALIQDFGPKKQEDGAELLTLNMQTISQKQTGQVSLDYFADAAFVGDSLTVGLMDYNINIGGALICAYTGIGPQNIVNRTTQNHSERGEEIILDVLSEYSPSKVYILLGTNSLVAQGNDESFLAYYDQMLEDIYATLGDDTLIYVQAVPPVTEAAVADERPGLESSRVASINESLALMAYEKGAVFLNLWEIFADENGNLKADLAANDGTHFTAGGGYTAWVNYLRTHAKYDASNEWTAGSDFAD